MKKIVFIIVVYALFSTSAADADFDMPNIKSTMERIFPGITWVEKKGVNKDQFNELKKHEEDIATIFEGFQVGNVDALTSDNMDIDSSYFQAKNPSFQYTDFLFYNNYLVSLSIVPNKNIVSSMQQIAESCMAPTISTLVQSVDTKELITKVSSTWSEAAKSFGPDSPNSSIESQIGDDVFFVEFNNLGGIALRVLCLLQADTTLQ